MKDKDCIEIYGAKEHNLKNIDVKIPRNKLVVITGVSGSGKSSLAFDTIYAEGQRRYMESFSAYARSFIGNMERPNVDKIEGLSPVIAIEQKTTTRNPRSTVGTTTEIYDFFRLLFARAGIAYSYVTGEKMVKQSEDQIIDLILEKYQDKNVNILAPVVKGRKGHYRELFVQVRRRGYNKIRIDGKIEDLEPKMQLDRYKIHDIEIVVDRLKIKEKDRYRLSQAVQLALKEGNGMIMILVQEEEEPVYLSQLLVCPTSGVSYDEPAPNMFSFNSPYGACPSCNGLGEIEEVTEEDVIPNKKISINSGGIAPLGEYRDIWIFKQIQAVLKAHKFNITTPIHKLSDAAYKELLYGADKAYKVFSDKYQKSYTTVFEGIIPYLERILKEGTNSSQDWIREYLDTKVCKTCNGGRLKKESLHFKVDGLNIHEVADKNIENLWAWVETLEDKLNNNQKKIATPILKEIRKRVKLLLDIGLYYLNLDRPLKTLSGGEAQRIRLATQIGTQLVGVLYILDEPSIGLHARDNFKLIQSLKDLRDLGNSVIVVEHDKDMMLACDYLIDIGPKAGIHGGQVIFNAAVNEKSKNIKTKAKSCTLDYLQNKVSIEAPKERRKGNGEYITLKGATGNNLKNVTLKLPLGKMICITGVSGSGKSSLIHETLFPIINKHLYKAKKTPLAYKKIEGLSNIDKVIEVDQSPIGRTPRSNPATYVGFFTDIRSLFAQMPEAKIRGYKPGRFSFNVKGGRCEACKGGGLKLVEMDFLPNVYVECESCKGKRYNRETLEVRFKSKSISDILEMTVAEAVNFFENQPIIKRKIEVLNQVGLGYIKLGQASTTISGGEAQRVKLASELCRKDTGKTLYILDEPTTGLHFEDIRVLLGVLNQLVDKGNTVLIIEHNLDVIKVADHVIDLGLEGGENGGNIIFEGSPEDLIKHPESYTGKFLKLDMDL